MDNDLPGTVIMAEKTLANQEPVLTALPPIGTQTFKLAQNVYETRNPERKAFYR